MVRHMLAAAAISILVFAPLAWSEAPQPSAAAGEPPDDPVAGDRDPDADAESLLQRALRERTAEIFRQVQNPGRRELRIEVAPHYPRAPRAWTCRAGGVGGASVAGGSAAGDPCELGRRLAEMPPCLDPGDCEALHLWNEEIGPPAVQQARPLEADPPPAYRWTLEPPAGDPPPAEPVEDAPPSRD